MRKMRRSAMAVLATLLVAAAALLALSACKTTSGSDDATTSAAAQETGTGSGDASLPQLRIGTDSLEPLFYIGSDGEFAGIDADIATEACRRAGLEAVFVDVAWGDRIQSLEDGDVDCLWGGFAREGYEDDFLWTDTYLETKLAMLVGDRCPSTSLGNYRGPGGVAVRADSVAEKFFLEEGYDGSSVETDVNAYATMEAARASFIKGFSDSWVTYKLVLDQLQQAYPTEYRYLDDDLMTLNLAVAFCSDYDGPYYRQINDALDQMVADGTVDAIVQKYTGAEASGDVQ